MELDWTDSDLHYSRREGEANMPVTWSHPDLSEPVTEGWNKGIKIGNRERLKSLELRIIYW